MSDDLVRGPRALDWLMMAVGIAAAAGSTALLYMGKATFWTVTLGWPVSMLLAWAIGRHRGLRGAGIRKLMITGFLAILLAPFVDSEGSLPRLRK